MDSQTFGFRSVLSICAELVSAFNAGVRRHLVAVWVGLRALQGWTFPACTNRQTPRRRHAAMHCCVIDGPQFSKPVPLNSCQPTAMLYTCC